MKLNYRQKLFLYFGIIFTLFTAGMAVFQQLREKKLKTEALIEKLESYTDMIHAQLSAKDSERKGDVHQILPLLPKELRVTLISSDGEVWFDNAIHDFTHLQNHLRRPEVQSALVHGKGSDIRRSASDKKEYLYFARLYDNLFIRAALPYSVRVHQFLKPDNASIYFMLTVFILFLFLIHITTRRFEKSVRQLRDFASSADHARHKSIHFPKNELGEIGGRIADNYRQLKETQLKNAQDKQKLLQHIHILEEGICFFTASHRVDFYNGLFIQYLNTITDEPAQEINVVLSDPVFWEIQKFLSDESGSYIETQIQKQGKTFSVRVNIFEDKSYEITLNDITRQEKTRLLKLEMTSNIAHELRTPLTGIRGYLETVLNQSLNENKKQYFIEKAFNQTVILSAIIQDMGQLARMEESPGSFAFEEVSLTQLLQRIKTETTTERAGRNIQFDWDIPDQAVITGNPVLLYALFRNLTDNAIRYAGENIRIGVTIYNETDEDYYFSFYDTGKGIEDESKLNRIFERFYRIGEGRTRDQGGSGLGLSIVRNTVLFHQGKIVAKNRKNGGLEFLFSLRKRRKHLFKT